MTFSCKGAAAAEYLRRVHYYSTSWQLAESHLMIDKLDFLPLKFWLLQDSLEKVIQLPVKL